MAERRDPETLRALETRRAESTRAILLAPLLALLVQPFLLIALGNENVGWLARLAVLAAAWGALLAAAWTVLRSRAREAQLEAELEAAGVEGFRPESLPRPRHHEPPEPPPPAPGVTGLTPPPPREPVTPKLEAALAPETDEGPLPDGTGKGFAPETDEGLVPDEALAPETDEELVPPATDEEALAEETPLAEGEPLTPPPGDGEPPADAGEMVLPEGTEAETEVFAAAEETELIEEPEPSSAPRLRPAAEADSAPEVEEGEPRAEDEAPAEGSRGRRAGRAKRERQPWVRRWDHHVVWWASGPEHARPYMAWVLALGLFAVADLAVFLATI